MRAVMLLLLVLMATGCQTEIRFKNSLPNATLKDVRWVSGGTGEAYASDVGDPLRSGETSESISVYGPEDEGTEGKLHFELVVQGRRVALVTKRAFKARRGETSTFEINRETEVVNPVLESAEPER